MKATECKVCGGAAKLYFEDDPYSGRTLYGVECSEGHRMGAVFETRNRAVRAWNECQAFVGRYAR